MIFPCFQPDKAQFYVFPVLDMQNFLQHTAQFHKLLKEGVTYECNFPFCFPGHLAPLGGVVGCGGVQLQGVPHLWWLVMIRFLPLALRSFWTHFWVRFLLHSPLLWILKARNYLLLTQNSISAVRWRAWISDSAAVGDFLGNHPTLMTWRRNENKATCEKGRMYR